MADKKISALTAASTPLAGTEVAPIVQAGATVKVAISDILHTTADYIKGQNQNGSTNNATGAGLASSAKTTGTAAAGFGSSVNFDHFDSGGGYAGCKVASVMPSGDGNTSELVGFSRNYGYVEGWRVDIAGNVKFSQNIYITTSGNGIDFSATPGTGTSELLNDYEEGTWTPTQGGGLTVIGSFSSEGTYTIIGRTVVLRGKVTGSTSIAVAANTVLCGGLPVNSNVNYSVGSVTNANLSQVGAVIATGATIYSTAIAATTDIYFTVTYYV